MAWFWGSSSSNTNGNDNLSPAKTEKVPASGCPVQHGPSNGAAAASGCPVSPGSSSTLSGLFGWNSATSMPTAATLQAPAAGQASQLSQTRTASSIPRVTLDTDGSSTWTYPSPQMFYHALRRKGYETEVEDVEHMLGIHNMLNEGVWQQVLEWERLRAEDASKTAAVGESKLERFMGKPTQWSPRAYWNVWVRGAPEPFDRHDWWVTRTTPSSSASRSDDAASMRYIIDYYPGRPEPDGSPTFHVDVRPALDSPQALWMRFCRYWNL